MPLAHTISVRTNVDMRPGGTIGSGHDAMSSPPWSRAAITAMGGIAHAAPRFGFSPELGLGLATALPAGWEEYSFMEMQPSAKPRPRIQRKFSTALVTTFGVGCILTLLGVVAALASMISEALIPTLISTGALATGLVLMWLTIGKAEKLQPKI